MVRRMGVLVNDHRPSPPIMTLVTAALISSDDFVNVAHWGQCEHGRLLRHVPELTTVAAATSGRPSGLHPMACHTASMVAPSDPSWRAATVGGFTFGSSDPPIAFSRCRLKKMA